MVVLFADPINLLDGLIGRLAHGPLHQFTFSTKSGFTGGDVEFLLRQYGVPVWGRGLLPDEQISLHVKQSQAIWAEYLLCRAGVPLTCELLDPRNAAYQERHAPGTMPQPWDERGVAPHSFVAHVVDWLNRLIG
jgi:hypothetical protein